MRDVSDPDLLNQMQKEKIDIEELKAWSYALEYLLDILNCEYSVEQAREDILSFRGTEHYTGTNEKFKLH